MNIQSLKGAVQATSAYVDGQQIGTNCTVRLPEATPAISEVTGAGGTIEVPMATKIDPMGAGLTVRGVSREWLDKLTPEPHTFVANIVQQKVNTDGSSTPEHIKATFKGIPKVFPSIEASYGESMELEITIAVHSYKLAMNGITVRHIDPIKGIYKINGKDFAEKVKAMI